jgi:hypothetical protein
MKTFALLLTALVLPLAACGGAAEPAPAAPTAAAAAEPAHDHGDLPLQVAAFHDTLRPLWHDESAERQSKTCAQTGELVARAGALGEVEVAEDRREGWTAAIGELSAALGELEAACTSGGDFAASFTRVHDGFHTLLEAGGGKPHGEHGEHGAGDHGHGHGHGDHGHAH